MDRWITDWPISPRFPLLTRANAGEVLPDPCSPLGWTLVWEPGCVQGWRDSAELDYGSVDPGELDSDRPEVVGILGGYLYINASSVRLFGVRGPGLTPEAIDYVYFGEHPDVPKFVLEDWHENAAASERMGAWMMRVLTADDLPELRADRDLADSIRRSRPDLARASDEVLVDRARSLIPTIRHLFRRHLAITAASSIGPGILTAVAGALGDPTIALRLITAVGEVDSAAPSHAMWDLSRLDAASSEYRAGFEDLIARFGSRGPNEWDIRSEVWETRPQLATALIDAMRAAADGDSPAVRNERNRRMREDLTADVRAKLAGADESTRAQFEMGLRSAHVHLQGRERAKTNVVKVLHEVRMAVRELGARHGYAPSLVCMLLADELDAFVSEPDGFRARLTGREEQYLSLFELEPPFIVNGEVPPLDRWERRGGGVVTPVTHGEQLLGVPGAPGRAVGRARVVTDPGDPRGLEPGEILVAPITDPAWTPLFVPAAGVVVDVGAQVSHAVIVSRELGIPCVVSVKDATRRIVDGTMLMIDGDSGTVTVLPVD
jgi:pyruvate,water dikinase